MAKRKTTSKGAQVGQQSKDGKRTKSSVDNSNKRAPKGVTVSQNKSHAAQSAIGQSTSNAVVDRRLPKAKSSKRQTQKQKFKRNVHDQTNVLENDCGLTSTHRQLLKFKTLEDILYLAKRLFQREPEIYEGVNEARLLSPTKSEEAGYIRQYILSTIEAVVGNNSNTQPDSNVAIHYAHTSLPKRWANYISFCDVVYMSLHANEKNWTTFLMTDYPKELHNRPTDIDEDQSSDGDKENRGDNETNENVNVANRNKKWKYLPIGKIRKRFKKFLLKARALDIEDEELASGIVASVQTDSVPISEDAVDAKDANINLSFNANTEGKMLLIRITTTRRTSNLVQDENKLLIRRPTFFAYFPGEPYFYATNPNPNPKYCQALVKCLYSTSYHPIPLCDRDVFSLRRLRLNRDTLFNNKNNNGIMSNYNEALLSRYIIDGNGPSIEDPWESNDNEHSSTAENSRLPKLTKFGIRCVSKFWGDDSFFENTDDCRGNSSQDRNGFEDLAATIQFSGSDVLNAFSSLASYCSPKSCNYFETPIPNWLKGSACRGRNFLEIRTGKRKIPANSEDAPNNREIDSESVMQSRPDDDAMSIAASEMTNWGEQNRTNFNERSLHLELTRRNKSIAVGDNRLRNIAQRAGKDY